MSNIMRKEKHLPIAKIAIYDSMEKEYPYVLS